MSHIAVIIDDMFEDSEYTQPVEAFKKEGHETTLIGLQEGKIVKGKKHGTTIKIDKAIKDVTVNDFDALLIPGGFSPDKLRAHDEAVAFCRNFMQSGKPIFMICHGPQLMISADVLKGKKVTGWKSIIQDLKNAGAEFFDQEVVVDNNLVSSRNPDDLPAFIEASLSKLK